MCSLKSLHCTECALLDSVPFCTGKDVSNLSHSVWSRLFFNLFPSPFFCVTNFNAVYLESQRYCERAHSSIAHFFFFLCLCLSRSLFFFHSIDFFCCTAVALCASWRFVCVYVCAFLSFLVSFWSNAELALSCCFQYHRFVRLRIANRNLIKSVRLESRETM